MRSFADTLPTLRDSAPGTANPPPFDPAAIMKAFGTHPLAGDGEGEGEGEGERAEGAAHAKPREPRRTTRATDVRAAEAAAPKRRTQDFRHALASIKESEPADTAETDDAAAREAEIARRIEAARAEERAKTTAEVDAARNEAAAAQRRAIEEAREAWCAEEAAKLVGALESAFGALHAQLSDAIGRCLEPIVSERVRDAALERFAKVLDKVTAGESAARTVTVTAPHDLADAVRRALDGRGGITTREGSDPDVTAQVSDTRVRIALGTWAARLESDAKRSVNG